MKTITVTPLTAKEVLSTLDPGSEVIFAAGNYEEILELELKSAPDDVLTILRGEPGAIITMGLSAEEYRETGNVLAKAVQDRGGFPGLYPYKMNGRFKLKNCANVIIENLTFEKSWPTHIAIENCQDLIIRTCEFQDATFAIAATGEATYGITIEECNWVQDRQPGRMWLDIPWFRIHGDQEDKHPPVDVKEDWRLFDGDFFRAEDIAGGVTIRHCKIGQAFNAIHLYNTKLDPRISIDINVHDCHFYEIRDNVLEPEKAAFNWWFWNNTIKNAHKPFSIDVVKGGAFYIFSNLWWFDSIQGPEDIDKNRGGGMFKFSKKIPKKRMARSYVFHNSIATRSDYARKGLLYGLQHLNNAIWVIREGIDYGDLILKKPKFFGDLSVPDSDPEYLNERFTTSWRRLDIRFEGNVVYDESWPDELHDNGYDQIQKSIPADPLFKNFRNKDDLTLKEGSPCVGQSRAQTIEMPIGDDWHLSAGQDIGAYQGDELTKGPAFRPVADQRKLRPIKAHRHGQSV